jgi:hypothetical protein
MKFLSPICAAFGLVVVLANPAFSAELKIFGSRVTKMVVEDIGLQFERATGHKGTSNNCPRLSGTPNLPTNDSALFSFRFCAVHPKDVRDCLPRQLFEVPIS